MASDFDRIAAWLKQIEGGYVDDDADRGGATRYGISQQSYPDLDIASLTWPQAKGIYFRDYWLAAHCDRLPQIKAWLTFDAAVHHGPRTAVRLLQQSLGVSPDGVFGPVTRKAAWDHQGIAELMMDQLSRRAQLMHDLTLADSRQARFLRGWMKRLFSLQQFCLAEVLP